MSSSFARSLAFAALATLGAAAPLVGQVVEGQLRDDEGAAVAGATVLLLDAGFQQVGQDVTDAVGAFRLQAPSAGDYVVVAQLEGYASITSDPFPVAAGSTTRHDLTLSRQGVGQAPLAAADTLEGAELVARAIADACRGEFLPAMHGIVFGVVVDSATAQPLPEVETVVRFKNTSGMPGGGELRARTNESGIYLICNAPAGQPLNVRPEAMGMTGREVTATVRSGTMRKLDLSLGLSDPNRPGAIFGRVLDQQSGQPIAGAEIRIKDAGLGTVSNDRGVFRLPEVPTGLQVVTVDHLGHGHQEQAVRVLGGQAAELEVRLTTEAIAMAPMLVRVRPRRWYSEMSGLEDRIANGSGFILTPEDLEERQPRNLAEALRGVPGVDVTQSGGSLSGGYVVQMRNAQSMDGRICTPMIWIDGQKAGRESSLLSEVFGPDLYAVEIYRSGAETPGEFHDYEASCGTVVAWTKRGR